MSTKSVLVAVAGDDNARIGRYTDIVETLTGRDAIEVHLVHVYPEEDAETVEEMYDIDSQESRQLDAAEHNTAIKARGDELGERDIEFTTPANRLRGDRGRRTRPGPQRRLPPHRRAQALAGRQGTVWGHLLTADYPVVFLGTKN
ncbi:hypothetical protein [Natrinema gelatinilyticum]|uniref:hypothetical protein n=1 Tax=Natrinema gelatinilyticum TaxID=2961571 RepID=UPI0020C45038|nr:hypothetical protein [Natrinema gelatinilyticum]